MARLSDISLGLRLVLTTAVMLIALTGALTYLSYLRQYDSYIQRATDATRTGFNILAFELVTHYPDTAFTPATAESEGRMTWGAMPSEFPVAIVDEVTQMTALEPTIFDFDPANRQFIRVATTLRDGAGNRTTGTALQHPDALAGLTAGEPTTVMRMIDGSRYMVRYQPIFDEGGTVSGAIGITSDFEIYADSIAAGVRANLMSGLAALAAILAIALLMVRRMIAPLGRMKDSIVSLSEGKLSDEIPFGTRGDEIGAISKGLIILQASMRNAQDLKEEVARRQEQEATKQRDLTIVVETLTNGLSQLSDLDITTRIEDKPGAPFPSEYDGLRKSFNQLADRLSDSIIAIRDAADEVMGDAREMAGSSSDLSSRTEAQAATLQESAAALEELSQSVQSTAENAADAEVSTNESRDAANQTGTIVENAVSAMAAIEASSQKITQIISVIDDIAFQTNLLALNAGVEAARAGEAGRGFAVVASEVRALAQHSSASAQEIKTLIAASSEQVGTGSKLVREAGVALGDIISRVDRVAGLVSDIAVSAKEQSVGVGEINSGIRDLDAATQRNAAMAEEASAASEGLTSAADRMAGHLARFKLSAAKAKGNWAAAAVATMSPPVPTPVSTPVPTPLPTPLPTPISGNMSGPIRATAGTAPEPPRAVAAGGRAQSKVDPFRDF